MTIEVRPDGAWELLRERSETGERFVCDDLREAFDVVLRSYRPDGTPREWPTDATGNAKESQRKT